MSIVTVTYIKMSTTPHIVDEFPGLLRVYSDGSVWRSAKPSRETTVDDDGSILWKDVVFDTTSNLALRLYKPVSHSSSSKFPIFCYFHGGGFCIGSRTWPHYHNYCLKLGNELQAVVISVDYRLAPENRLPSAIEDGFAAMKWLQAQATALKSDAWLTDVADFSRVFVFGDSSGGNIAYHLAVRLGAGSSELAPVRVKGYVFLTPFFGGTVLTRSEADAPKDALLQLEHVERFWRLSMPLGENKDHPIVNPSGLFSPDLEKHELDPILMVVGESDLLRDRVKDSANELKRLGKKIEYVEFEGQEHGFYTFHPESEASKELMLVIKKFIEENSVYEIVQEIVI